MTGRVLILGGSGRFGRNVTEAFWNAGWRVELHDRTTGNLMAEAKRADVIVYGWNPKYQHWARDVPGQIDSVIAAARASGATVLFPGNVYVYGEDAPADFGPHLPSAAQNPLGRVRVAAEAALRASGVQVILLRAGDFLDTEASGNWFDIKIAESLPRGYLTYPGDPDSPHAWAYLPDVARACVALAEKRVDLPQYSEIAFPGYTLTGRELAQLCADAMGRPVAVRTMALWPLRLLAPFVPMIRHLLEMSYLWRKPHHLTRESFDAVLPGFRPTPVEEAIARAIAPLVKTDPDRSTPTDAAPHPA